MTDAPELCPRCGSGGYGCYECTPRTYTQADLEAHIGAVLEEAAKAAGDAAVAALLRQRPDAKPLLIQMTRQVVANPIRALRPDAMQALERVRREARVDGMRALLAVGAAAADAYADPYGDVWSAAAVAMAEFIEAEERGEAQAPATASDKSKE